MKKFISKLLFSSFLFLLTACGQSSLDSPADSSTIRIATNIDPPTLDPRMSRNLENSTILHHLYEGLTRINLKGKAVPALADKYEISDDQKTYTFHLKKSVWSNGDPLFAEDFVQTWRSILDPSFPAPNAYQLYVIQGAKSAKEGKTPLQDIGIHAKDRYTLIVELVEPTPYFLDLVATHFFYPVHKILRENPNSKENIASNGPYKLLKRDFNNELSLVKNPSYYDAEEIGIDKIVFYVLDENTSLKLFEKAGVDWIGSPMNTIPQDAILELKKEGQLQVTSGAGTHWFRLNTQHPPFNNIFMRKAFALALNRHEIVEHVTQGNQAPAMEILPAAMALQSEPYFQDNDTTAAWENYQKALEEMNLSKDEIPSITLCYAASDRNRKIAQTVQQQWQKALGITIHLESCESKVQFEKLSKKDYQIALGSWFADIMDPVNFLEIFKHKDNGTNNTEWGNPQYTELLDLSATETDPAKRKHLLHKAEELLMKEMPVIPLFHSAFNYVKNDQILGVYFSELGYLDFKEAFIENLQFQETLD